MKKIITLSLALIMLVSGVLAFSSCAKKENKLIVGYTLYEPMNYMDGDELVGFDTELARAVAEKLSMEIEFKEIEWKNKYLELESGSVTCLWNGFTSNCADDDLSYVNSCITRGIFTLTYNSDFITVFCSLHVDKH